MSTRGLLAGLVGVVAVAAAAFGAWALTRPDATTATTPPPATEAPPNVLVILWDTTRADRMSLYGHDVASTPKMAAWAKKHGVVFQNAVSPDMWTVPSHASLFTGLASTTHGAGNEHKWLDNAHVTLAEYLSENGWDTYAFSANPNLSPQRLNLVQGFQEVDLSWGPGFKRPSLMNMKRKLIPEDKSTEISPANEAGMKTSFYNAAPVTHKAFVKWLDEREDPKKPFLAYLSYMEAHKPRIPSMAARKRVADQATLELGLATDLTYDSQLLYSYGKKSYTPEELEAVRRVYDATLVDLDDATSSLLEDLESKGILRNTIVVFTSDHGEQLGEHQLFGHRAGVYEPLLHVPLVISWPKEVSPRTIAEPVSNTRIFATLMDLLELPGPPTPWVKGSLLDAAQQAPTVFAETIGYDKLGFKKVNKAHPDLKGDDWAVIYKSVRKGNLKLIQGHDPESMEVVRSQLFDLDADPHELHDLSTEQPGATAELGRAIEEWQDTIVHWTPEGADVPVEHEPSEAQRKQLEMLGYIEEE